METRKAEKLRERWGNNPCTHESLEKEYYLGSATGDYVCKLCGRSGLGKDWPEKERDVQNGTKKDE
jgi:hypothetical protein